MKTLLIPYSENYRMNVIIASFVGVITLVASTRAPIFVFGFIICIILLGRSNGIEIDKENNRFREYKKLFGWLSGNWLPLDRYSDIVIQSKPGSKSVLGMRLTAEIKIKVVIHTVFMMDESHMSKVFLKTCPSYEEAKKFAELLALQTGLELAAFNPASAKNYPKGRR